MLCIFVEILRTEQVVFGMKYIKLNYKQAHGLIQDAGTNIFVVNASNLNKSVLSKTLIPIPAY